MGEVIACISRKLNLEEPGNDDESRTEVEGTIDYLRVFACRRPYVPGQYGRCNLEGLVQ